MEIYLIRHGQTDWNKLFKVQGRIDNSLNAVGKNQAKEISNRFKEIKPTILLSSPLNRAIETMNILKYECKWDIPLQKEVNFIEREFGELEGTDAKEFRKVNDFSRYELYESDSSIERRVLGQIKELIKQNKEDDVIVVTCHSHVIKAFLTAYDSQKYDYTYRLENCESVKINIKENKIQSLTFIKI